MRILIFQDYLRCGGTERQSLFLAEYFKGKGHVVELLTIRPGGVLTPEAQARGVVCKSVQPFDFKIDWFAWGVRKRIQCFAPDVVLCMGRIANAFGGYLQRLFPSVVVIGTARTGKVLPVSNFRSFRCVRGIIVNTKWWKRRLVSQGIPQERVEVVYNSCVLRGNTDAGSREEVRASLGVCSNTCVFLNVASLRKRKRHETLIRIVAFLGRKKDWVLWIVGAGPELKACKTLATSLGISDRVHFWGYQEDPTRFYVASDVAVSASIEDSLPNFLVEAQFCGLPVVASDYRGVKECFIDGGGGYLVGCEDDQAFVVNAKKLLDDPALREQQGAQAREWATARFSPHVQGQAHLDFFDKFLPTRDV